MTALNESLLSRAPNLVSGEEEAGAAGDSSLAANRSYEPYLYLVTAAAALAWPAYWAFT